MPSKKDMMAAIKQDYPNLPDDYVELVLDVYEKDAEYIERLCKQMKKESKHKGIPPVKTQLTLDELDRLSQKHKEDEERWMQELVSYVVPNDADDDVLDSDENKTHIIQDGESNSEISVSVCEQ